MLKYYCPKCGYILDETVCTIVKYGKMIWYCGFCHQSSLEPEAIEIPGYKKVVTHV